MAEVEDAGLGSSSAELEILQQVDALDVWTVDLATAIDLSVNEDAGGAINFARGETYFQLAVIVSDVPYAFDLEYEFDEPSGPFITNAEHFVCQYGSGSVLYPRTEPYILLWGGMDYTASGLDSSGWGYLCAHAETNVTLSIEPVPEPITLSLLAVGGLAVLRQRRKA
ncbi:MAG: PEP-CTERM sorting domain-containing protein [Phycisphaerae bacterium]|nr:PEP-CTERM sorting domain-containing protein [Phycisphaerae bacterium]